MVERDLLKEVGFDRTPKYIVDKSITDLMDLEGKKAIVTGAGAWGLGAACAHRLGGLGAEVVLVDRDLDGAERVAAEVADKWGTTTHAVQADVTDWDDVHRFMKESHELLGGRIDILVNNVGAGDVRPFKDQNKDQIDATIALSYTDTVYCSRAVLDYMIPQGSGRIINVASEAARNISPSMVVYGSAKAGVVHFTRCLANEVGELGINVTGVAPGTMLKPELQEMLRNPEGMGAAAAEAITMRFPVMDFKRVSIPEEVANVVGFLATDAAAYLTGVTINAGGGIAAMG